MSLDFMKKLLKFLKTAAINVFCLLGGSTILHAINRTPRVIYWHGVTHIINASIETESIDVSVFEQEIKYLANKFDVISMDEFYVRYQNKKFNGCEAVLTFDDGYFSNLQHAAPVMKKYGLPFTVFISTGNISSQEYFPTSIVRLICIGAVELSEIKLNSISFYHKLGSHAERCLIAKKINSIIKKMPHQRVIETINELESHISPQEYALLKQRYRSLTPMNWLDVKQLSQISGCTIGSHCIDHFCCHEQQSYHELQKQLFNSKDIIQRELNVECYYFAYPNGDYTAISNQLLEAAGYRLGFTTTPNRLFAKDESPFALPRYSALPRYNSFKIYINTLPQAFS